MRRVLTFACDDAQLVATLDEAPDATGLLIVSGGNEIRIGAHRGMARLAADIVAVGYPVFRFDRRGIGDSEGENHGFESSGPDIAAAIEAFRAECPALTRIVAFGNCDAASALVLHRVGGIDALILANPWVIETSDGLPPPAAIRARYLEKLRDPKKILGVFTGAVDIRKLEAGLSKLLRPKLRTKLAASVAHGMMDFTGPISVVLARRDATAIAFAAEWRSVDFRDVRSSPLVSMTEIGTASHSFANETDYAALTAGIVAALRI